MRADRRPSPPLSNETTAVDWFAEDGLPALSTTRVLRHSRPRKFHRFFDVAQALIACRADTRVSAGERSSPEHRLA
jgi:hypothetical protein